MDVQVVEPRADILVESTRSMGYTFELREKYGL